MAECSDPVTVSPKQIFDYLVTLQKSRLPLPNDALYTKFPSASSAVAFLKKHSEYFIVFESEEGEASLVGARLENFKVCTDYGVKGSFCNEKACTGVHICQDFIAGYCNDRINCRKSHHFQSKHNRAVLEGFQFSQFDEDNLRHLLRMSLPEVCNAYNHNACNLDDKCTYFHVCDQYLQDACLVLDDGDECFRGKSHTFDSPHSKRLLAAYKLEKSTAEEIRHVMGVRRAGPRYRVQEDPLAIRRRIRDLRPNQDSAEDWEDMFRFMDRRRVVGDDKGGTKKVVAMADRAVAMENMRAWQDGDLEMLKTALEIQDEDELMSILSYQVEIDQQHVNAGELLKPGKPAGNPDHSPSSSEDEDTAPESDRPDNDSDLESEDLSAAAGSQPVAKTPAQSELPLVNVYTGYAPQGHQKYICEDALVNKCLLKPENCEDAHYVSPYLWQVQVSGRWYNLDTVTEDIEKSHRSGDPDYITNMPVEVPKLAGQLMTIFFKKMAAEITLDMQQIRVRVNRDQFPIRRIGKRDDIARGGRLTKIPAPPRKTTPKGHSHLQQIFRSHGMTEQAELAVKPSPFIDEEQKEDAALPLYQWQVKTGAAWRDLKQANREIEEAFSDLAPDYVTMISSEDQTAERPVEIRFSEMQAIYLDMNETVPIRRKKPGENDEVIDDAVSATESLRTKRLAKFEAEKQTEQIPKDESGPKSADNGGHTTVKKGKDPEKKVAELGMTGESLTSEPVTPEPEEWCWSWSEDFQNWTVHDPEFSGCLEAAYQAGKTTGTLRVNGEKIKIDFKSMVETSKSDSKTRLLKRHPKT